VTHLFTTSHAAHAPDSRTPVHVPERPRKLDPYAVKLAAIPRVEADKSRKHKRTVKQLHADPVSLVDHVLPVVRLS